MRTRTKKIPGRPSNFAAYHARQREAAVAAGRPVRDPDAYNRTVPWSTSPSNPYAALMVAADAVTEAALARLDAAAAAAAASGRTQLPVVIERRGGTRTERVPYSTSPRGAVMEVSGDALESMPLPGSGPRRRART